MEAQIGKTIQRARRRLGLTQEALAERADVSVRWLSKVENGRGGAPRMDYLRRVARAVSLEVEDLVRGDVGRLSASVAARRRGTTVERSGAAVRPRVERLRTRWGTVIGDVWFPWVVASYGPHRPEHIASYFEPEEPAYPPEVEQALSDLRSRDAAPDSDAYKLVRFHVSARVGEQEEPKLILHFRPTTRHRALVTDERLDVPLTAGGRTFTLRERYAADVDLRSQPVPELATRWGVGLSVVTADGMLVVVERDDRSEYWPAVAAGSVRSLDGGPDGVPDHFATARRAMREELAFELRPGELTWLSFGADAHTCAYSLVGRVEAPCTLADLENGRSRDAGRMHGVELRAEAVARFCSDPRRRFSPLALITLVHTLMHEFGVSRTEETFRNMSVNVTARLPQWLTRAPGD